MKRHIGLVAIIGAMLANGTDKDLIDHTGMSRHELSRHQSSLILNNYGGPMPRRMLNQRQQRKQWRQSPCSRPKSNRK